MSGATKLVLLIDDEPGTLAVVGQLFERRGWTVAKASSGKDGLESYARERPDLVMLDLDMPVLTGTQVLQVLRERDPEATVIILSGTADVSRTVECMQLGAESILTKPLEPRHFAAVVDRAYEKAELRRRNRILSDQQSEGQSIAALGDSPLMRELGRQLTTFAAGNAPILLTGETGCGKGWVARLIHTASPRHAAPFVSVNCAGLSATFLDSELFGHERGAFTDAKTQKPGLFEVAHGGTLLLDEIGDLAPELQPKLLTVLETQRFRRLGGTREIAVDVRLIAATHVDLAAAVKAGRFREDLYYRVSALPLHVPSLRERGREAIADLATDLLFALHKELGRGPDRLGTDALADIVRYPWPGNVRELKNTLERAMLVGVGEKELKRAHLPAQLRDGSAAPNESSIEEIDDLSLAQAERRHIERVLRHTDGNRAQAAKLLGISRQTLYSRIKEHGME